MGRIEVEIFDFNKRRQNENPFAFTERGLYMLATILKSERATWTTLAIIDAFYKHRLLTRQLTALPDADEPTWKSILQKSGELIADLLTDELPIVTTEPMVELNLAVLKTNTRSRKTYGQMKQIHKQVNAPTDLTKHPYKDEYPDHTNNTKKETISAPACR